MKNIRKGKEFYHSLKIPKKLNQIVEESIQKEKKKSWFYQVKPVLVVASSCCFVFVILLNVSPNFANAAYQIPVIREIAKIFTFQEYKEETDTELIQVKMPAIANTGNTKLEKKINGEVKERINALVLEAKKMAREYKQMIEEANDPEINFHPMELEINYEVKCSNEDKVSFIIDKIESMGYVHKEQYFYNVNLKTGEDITLQDMLGENYKEVVDQQVKEQIQKREQEDDKAYFFKDEDTPYLEHGLGFEEITEDQTFYINQEGQVVVVFPKYAIAPGYMGIIEFVIQK